MVLTEILFIPCAVCALMSTASGLGVRDRRLDPAQVIEASMYFTIFDLLYCITLGPLRCSLCLTLLRFATGKRMRQAIYIMVMVHIATTVACFVGLMALCRPYRTNWRHFYDFPGYPREGSCFSGVVIEILVYTLTAVTSISDLICVIIPGVLFWKSRMNRQTKIMAWMLLSLGLLASIATLVRLPFTPYWVAEKDRVWGLGMATLCCCVEIFLGIVAGCASAVKPFVVGIIPKIKSRFTSEQDVSLPTSSTDRVRSLKGLTCFSYNTTDLKTIHSPRGDVIWITPVQNSNLSESESASPNTVVVNRNSV
ncbi:hypothetical protein E4T48_07973 [Aureobasidium sp. EXF-10727]|nr:hypothetical protein E4T48_07973 [Aureobasidium sp. EXF-10727]